MLCAHMDEVGFVITNITENGLLKFTTVGNIRPEVLSGRDVLVGGKTPGVICAKPVHLLKGDEFENPVPVNELAIDIGADTREQAETLVQIGDNACFVPFFEHVHGTVKAKALDDRVGCFALITLMQPARIRHVFRLLHAGGDWPARRGHGGVYSGARCGA